MKQILYIVMMFCSVVASAQGLNDGMSVDKIREKIVNTFEKAASVQTEDRYSITGDSYSIFNCSESYDITMQTMSGKLIGNNEDGDRRLHMEEKQMKSCMDVFSSMFGECSIYCPKSYSLAVQTDKSALYDDLVIPIDTLRMGIRLAMHQTSDIEKSTGAYREWFSFNMIRCTNPEDLFFHTLAARYEAEPECMPAEKSNAEIVAEAHRIISDFLSNEKAVKVYDAKFESDDVYGAEGSSRAAFGKKSVRMDGKHYFISCDKNQMSDKAVEFFNRMKTFACKTTNMSLYSHINIKRRFSEEESDEEMLRVCIFKDRTPESKEHLITLGFDKNGLHILDVETEYGKDNVPEKWVSIKTISGNNVKWIKGLEP